MKRKLIIIIIYLLGYVCCYNYMKYDIMDSPYKKVWTEGDRLIVLTLSSFSWVGVMAVGITDFIEYAVSYNKPAKW